MKTQTPVVGEKVMVIQWPRIVIVEVKKDTGHKFWLCCDHLGIDELFYEQEMYRTEEEVRKAIEIGIQHIEWSIVNRLKKFRNLHLNKQEDAVIVS